MINMSRPAVLFDIDGTLAHTDALHFQAFNAMLVREGKTALSLDEYNRIVLGRTNTRIFADLFPEREAAEHAVLADGKEAAFRELAAGALEPMPGLPELLDWLDARTIPFAAVTNAPKANAETILDTLRLTTRFHSVVCGDELPRGKPDPLPYQVACGQLGVAPDACVAFEDSGSGVQSASRAGATVIGMMSSLSEAELITHGARFAITDFTDARLRPLIERSRQTIMGS